MRSTADVTGGKPIAVYLRWSPDNPLVAFYDIHGRKGEVLFISFIPDTTWENKDFKYTLKHTKEQLDQRVERRAL
jgi:hypothetical protein